MKNEEKKMNQAETSAITDKDLEQVAGGTVQNEGDKAIITGTQEEIETVLEKINYAGKTEVNPATAMITN